MDQKSITHHESYKHNPCLHYKLSVHVYLILLHILNALNVSTSNVFRDHLKAFMFSCHLLAFSVSFSNETTFTEWKKKNKNHKMERTGKQNLARERRMKIGIPFLIDCHFSISLFCCVDIMTAQPKWRRVKKNFTSYNTASELKIIRSEWISWMRKMTKKKTNQQQQRWKLLNRIIFFYKNVLLICVQRSLCHTLYIFRILDCGCGFWSSVFLFFFSFRVNFFPNLFRSFLFYILMLIFFTFNSIFLFSLQLSPKRTKLMWKCCLHQEVAQQYYDALYRHLLKN